MSARLFLAAASPVLQAGCLTAVGAGLAWKEILDERGTSTLARIVFYAFTPALTFSTLGSSITLDSLQHLWPLLLNMTVSTFLGLGIGAVLSKLIGATSRMRPLITCACAFANVGNLPLVFVSSLCNDPSSVFHKSLGMKCEQLGTSYVGVNMCAASLYQFTLAIYLLKPSEETVFMSPPESEHLRSTDQRAEGNIEPAVELLDIRGSPDSEKFGAQNVEATSFLNNVSNFRDRWKHGSKDVQMCSITVDNDQHGENMALLPPSSYAGGTSIEQHVTPSIDVHLPDELSRSTDKKYPDRHDWTLDGREFEMENIPGGSVNRYRSWCNKIWVRLMKFDWSAAFPLPTQAAFAGIVAGCTPPIRWLLFQEDSVLKPVAGALDLLGNGLIPSSIPLLGAVLFSCAWKSKRQNPSGTNCSDCSTPRQTIVAVTLTRLIIVPLCMLGFDVACLKLKIFSGSNAMFLLTMLLSNTTPTAINMQVSH